MRPSRQLSHEASKALPIRAASLAILLLGSAALNGCGLFHDHRPAWAKARVRPVDLPAPAAGARSDDGLYADAVRAVTGRDYASALDALQAARARDQSDPRVWNAFGVVYDKLGRFDLSGRYYAKAAALDPGSPIVASNRAYSRLIQTRGAPAEAEATVLAGADASPDWVARPADVSPPPVPTRPARASLVSRVAALLRHRSIEAPFREASFRMARTGFASAGDARIDLGQRPAPARPTILARANPPTGKTGTP